MEIVKFKTTIKCSGCVANVTPVLNAIVGENNWKVDTLSPEKILAVSSEDKVDPAGVIKAIESAGYKAERLS